MARVSIYHSASRQNLWENHLLEKNLKIMKLMERAKSASRYEQLKVQLDPCQNVMTPDRNAYERALHELGPCSQYL